MRICSSVDLNFVGELESHCINPRDAHGTTDQKDTEAAEAAQTAAYSSAGEQSSNEIEVGFCHSRFIQQYTHRVAEPPRLIARRLKRTPLCAPPNSSGADEKFVDTAETWSEFFWCDPLIVSQPLVAHDMTILIRTIQEYEKYEERRGKAGHYTSDACTMNSRTSGELVPRDCFEFGETYLTRLRKATGAQGSPYASESRNFLGQFSFISLWWLAGSNPNGYLIHYALAGWLLTALLISFGAQFFYDLVSKLVNTRQTGARPGAEGSDGRDTL